MNVKDLTVTEAQTVYMAFYGFDLDSQDNK